MSNKLKFGVECIHSSMLLRVETNADIFWIHLENELGFEVIDRVISSFVFLPNLKVVMMSGCMSEALHDRIDQLLEEREDQENLILTVWSEDRFSEALWEFINVYGSRLDVEHAKALIICDTTDLQMKLLTNVASAALAE